MNRCICVQESGIYPKGIQRADKLLTEGYSIDEVPTADVEEVKHGKWSGEMHRTTYYCARCSNCGLITPCLSYCGMCGAKMDGGKE